MFTSRILASILAVGVFVGASSNTFANVVVTPTAGSSVTNGSNITFKI